jgi:phenylalanyl-tRNA synthetase beta chain
MMLTYDYNSKRNNKDLGLFEIGKRFKKVDGKYYEDKSLAILMSGSISYGIKKEKVTFYDIKGVMEELLDSLGFTNRYSLVVKDIPIEFHPKASASIILNGERIGVIGKIHPNISRDNIYLMEINLDVLEKLNVKKLEYQEISKYPSISKDVAFILDKDITNEDIMRDMKKSAGKYLTDVVLFDIYDIDSKTHSLAYKMVFSSRDGTLTDEEVMPIFDKVIEDIKQKYNATLRDK